MKTACQYRIYPTKAQAETLETAMDACRTLYNQALHWRRTVYEQQGNSISYGTQAAGLTQLRKQSEFWRGLHVDIEQDALRRLDRAFDAFFRRAKAGENPGYPRFKGEGRYRSMTYSHLSVNLIEQTGHRRDLIAIPKLGKVKIRMHRPLPDGKVKNLTVRRKASGWYVSIAVEIPDVSKVEPEFVVGIDVGLESFLTTSEGDKVDNPRRLREAEAKLKRTQRQLSKRKKGSRRRAKVRRQIGKQHERIVNQRKDFHCKTVHKLFADNDAVIAEDLRISNMVQNHRLAKSISDASWGNFLLRCACKAESAGKHFVKVPAQGTSQICSRCGAVVHKSLSTRIHRCASCALVLDRDHNAALNVFHRGIELLRDASALRGGVAVVNAPDEARITAYKDEPNKLRPLGRRS